MAQRPIALAVSYGHTESVKNSGGELWNFFAEQAPENAKSPVTLFGHPGAAVFATLASTPGNILDGVVVNDKLYLWTTTGLYKVYSDGTSRKLGTSTLQAPARCDTNGLDIIAVDGIKAYKYTIDPGEDAGGTSVVEITDPDYYDASTVTAIDQYFVFPRDGTGQFFNSDLASTSFDGADIRTSEGSPDKVVSVLARTGELWVFGSRSHEVFYNAGATLGSPFDRINGAYGDDGIASPWACAKSEQAILWYSPAGTAYMAAGLQATPISTPAVVDAFNGMDRTTADCFVWKCGSHEFWSLTVGTVTMVYDLTTGLWHRAGTSVAAHPALRGAFCYGKTLMWNRTGTQNTVLTVSRAAYDWVGADITGIIIAPALHADQQNIPHGALEIEPDAGQGLAGDVGTPTISMSYSDDGGRTYKNAQSRSLGTAGQYKRRVKWNALGAARDRRYKLETTAKVSRALVSRAILTV